MDRGKAVVVVRDSGLESSLELALLAAGITPILHQSQGLDDLPLQDAATLIVGPRELILAPGDFVRRLRAEPWHGLVILITGDAGWLRGDLFGVDLVVILEMPFVGADLIAAIRGAWPST